MKRFTLLMITVTLACAVFAQQSRVKISQTKQNLRISTPAPVKNFSPENPVNILVASQSGIEETIGTTIYDLQTNASMATRIKYYDDGTMAGTWTRGTDVSPERGTGYNYFNGSAWGPEPTGRIEPLRTGWPSYAQLGANGEIVASHTDVAGIEIAKRTTKGTGAWTFSTVAGPPSAVDISWPRIITNGPDHNNVHMLAMTYSAYQGLDLALLYYRSLDGGNTWDKQHVILPGMTSADYQGFSADDYAWGTPHGDTIYFVVGGNWVDGFIMRSFDNGETWNKVVFFNNGAKMNPPSTYILPFSCTDGSVQVELTPDGIYHVVTGRMRAGDEGAGHIYFPGTDGLIYWNSTMPMLDDSLFLDTLDAHGQLIGYVVDPGTGDSIIDFPYYGVGLSSFPQLTTVGNSLVVLYSALTVGNPSPDNFNYRHLWMRQYNAVTGTWTDMTDLNEGLAFVYREFVFPSMAKEITPAATAEFIYQTADVPGSAVKDTRVASHDNNINAWNFDVTIGINDKKSESKVVEAQNRPNPFTGSTTFDVRSNVGGNLNLEVSSLTGQKLYTLNKGRVNPGITSFTFDGSSLSSGIYFYTLTVGKNSFTGKMIVK